MAPLPRPCDAEAAGFRRSRHQHMDNAGGPEQPILRSRSPGFEKRVRPRPSHTQNSDPRSSALPIDMMMSRYWLVVCRSLNLLHERRSSRHREPDTRWHGDASGATVTLMITDGAAK